MKRKLMTMLACCAVISGSLAVGTVSDKAVSKANASDYDNSLWAQYFDVESTDKVDFTTNATSPSYWLDGTVQSNGKGYTSGARVTREDGSGLMDAKDSPIGVGVTVRGKTTLTYKKPVFLGDNDIYMPLVEWVVTPVTPQQPTYSCTKGSIEMSEIRIKLTDVVDPSIFVEIRSKYSQHNNVQSYVNVRTNTMEFAGYNVDTLTSQENVKSGRGNGTGQCGAFAGSDPRSSTYFYDYQDSSVWLGVGTSGSVNKPLPRNEVGMRYVRDLDSLADMYGKTDQIFGGFTNGFVNLSIEIAEVNYPEATMVLRAIDGQTFVMEDNEIKDVVAPALDLEPQYKANIPSGEVGTAYPFIPCVAYDLVDGDDLTVAVKAIAPDGGVIASGDRNGSFIPTVSGNYTLVYSVADAAGNKAEKSFTVPVKEKLGRLTLVLDERVEIPSDAKVGDSVKTPEASLTGGSGFNSLTYKVIYAATGELYSDIHDFTLTKAGYYEVIYEYSDYLGGHGVYKKGIAVVLSEKPVFEKVSFPKAVVKGVNYLVPEAVAKDYASYNGEGKLADVTTEYSYDKVTWTKLPENRILAPSGDMLYIRYKARPLIDKSDDKEETSDIYELIVKDISAKGDLQKFFHLEGAVAEEISVENAGRQYVFKPERNNATMQFINPVSVDNVKMSFVFDNNADASFSAIEVTVADYASYDERVTFTLRKNGSGATVTVGKLTNSIAGAFSNNSILMEIEGDVLNDVYSSVGRFTTYDNGDEFKGFTSGKVYMTYTFLGVDTSVEPTGIRIVDFCGQPRFAVGGKAVAKPSITIDGQVETYVTCNSEIVLPKGSATDIFDTNVKLNVKVTDPDGQVVTSLSSVSLNGALADKDYKIRLTKYGKYTVSYTAKSSSGTAQEKKITVISADDVKPVIEIKGQFKTAAKVNTEYVLHEAIATDNYDSADKLKLYVFMFDPDGYIENITYIDEEKGVLIDNVFEETKYTFKKTGVYRIRYFVEDSYGNYDQKIFKVTVVE